MVAAEQEMQRGRVKLRSTRQELQRLAATVAKSERMATGLVADLRMVQPGVPDVLALRASAAAKAAALRTERKALERNVYRIARLDP